MTIKQRLFRSNILMIAVPVALAILFDVLMSVVMAFHFGRWEGGMDEIGRAAETIETMPAFLWAGLAMLLVMAGIIFLTNRILTRRMSMSITAPLDTLSYGVRQVRDGNLSFRLDYAGEDEFSPVCDDFNRMAERLLYLETARRGDEESRRELIAGISHDLRTPLTAIMAYLEGIEKGVAATEEQRKKYIGVIKEKAESLNHIIERLFLFSKLETSEFPLHAQPVPLGAAIAEMMRGFAEEYARKGLVIQTEFPKADVLANVDITLLRNVIVNILENSANYKTAETGELVVSVRHADTAAVIRLAGNGPGVPGEAFPKLFDVFYRADSSRGTKGSGLGLAISAKIIERMNGTIGAEATPGGGLTIVIRLPVLAEPGKKTEP
jgi:signal transduction histidine kinase